VATLVPVEEYVNTSYHPDREYVAGVVVERNVGELPHSRAQRKLIRSFGRFEESCRAFAFPEARVQVKSDRFRVPDVTISLGGEPEGRYFTTPPFLVIEILSPDDRHADLMEKIDDYRSFGIPWIWVIDPESHRGEIYTANGMKEARDGVMRTVDPAIEIPLPEILS